MPKKKYITIKKNLSQIAVYFIERYYKLTSEKRETGKHNPKKCILQGMMEVLNHNGEP